jgi:hypothetical protein
MPRISGPIPDHILRLMPKDDRKPLGKAGVTVEEAVAKNEAKAEKNIQKDMIAYLRQRGVRMINVSRMDKRKSDVVGWPDLTFCWANNACAVEVKRTGANPTEGQLHAIVELQKDGWKVRVLRSVEGLKEFLNELENKP